MPGIGEQLMGGVISKYIGQGGRMSGALGILDNIIKQREQERSGQAEITKSLLGVPEVARGMAKERGLPFLESEEDIQQKKLRDLQITSAEQSTTGTGPNMAMNRAISILKGLQTNTTSNLIALQAGMTREEFIAEAKDSMVGTYNNLPAESRQYFDESVGNIYDTTIEAYPYLKKKQKKAATPVKSKPSVSGTSKKTGKVGLFEYTIE